MGIAQLHSSSAFYDPPVIDEIFCGDGPLPKESGAFTVSLVAAIVLSRNLDDPYPSQPMLA
jgi:hypothetical protein